MESFDSYLLKKLYLNVKGKGDRLAKIQSAIDWEKFRPIIKAMYTNDTPRGERPNTDEGVMVKLLVAQQCRCLVSWRSRY
jgi:IS5 family transposase